MRKHIVVPPVKSRGRDIVRLAEHFLNLVPRNGHPRQTMGQDAHRILGACPWPGNVRELRGLMESLATLIDEPVIEGVHVATELRGLRSEDRESVDLIHSVDLAEVLRSHGWNVARAARHLGMARSTLQGRMTAAGIRKPAVAE